MYEIKKKLYVTLFFQSIGPSPPDYPNQLNSIVEGPDSVLLEWNIPVLTYDLETYVVRYGTNKSNLNLLSNVLKGFHAKLTDLKKNTTYYYVVEATNSVGTTTSNIISFTMPPGT